MKPITLEMLMKRLATIADTADREAGLAPDEITIDIQIGDGNIRELNTENFKIDDDGTLEVFCD